MTSLAPAEGGVFRPPWRSRQLPDVLRPLIVQHRAAHPESGERVLQRAFEVAARSHTGQYRRSGDQYVTHPLAVATILANLGMDTTTLVAALLHDTIEDTGYSPEHLRDDFGAEVSLLVDGVIKLDRIKLGDLAKAETIRKMIVAVAKDPRVLVIKLADRLHNMRTLTVMPRARQEHKAQETLEILVPLAERLGMNTVKWELEDICFRVLFPARYLQIASLVREALPQRISVLRTVTERVTSDLRSARITTEVYGRPRHLYSVYQAIDEQGQHFEDIDDLVSVRVLVDTVRECYAVLGVIHANWQLMPGRFKDYIAMPKFTMYQSLHTTVIGPTGKPVEMQIRTFAMHRTAEFGIAAHWKYKEQKGATAVGPPAHIDEMTWLRQLLDWQREASDPSEFLDGLRFDLASQEVYVFTPKGDVIPLPIRSTPVDFAYAVHTEVGRKCIGARVNGRMVPLESTLSNGDVIEIFTSKSATAGPAQDWLGFVKSPRARTNIRRYLDRTLPEEATGVVAALPSYRGTPRDLGVAIEGVGDDEQVKLAGCCRPMPGDDVFGYLTHSRGVSVHRTDCAVAGGLREEKRRVVAVAWEAAGPPVFLAAIQVEALDREKLLVDVTRVLLAEGVISPSAEVTTTRDRVAVCRFEFQMTEPQHLGRLVAAVRRIDGVFDAYRVTAD